VSGPTKVGLFLTNQQPPDRDLAAALGEQLQMARLAKAAGWDSIWTGHHYLSSFAQLQPVPFLARLAAETEGMELGIGVLVFTIENPVAVAESIATLDVICGGRAVLGVGLGYREVEFDAFAVAKGERVKRFEANLEIMRALWRGEAVSVDLPWCKLDEAKLTALPLRAGGPPLWIGATGDKAVERAARLADGWLVNPAATVEEIERQRGVFDAARPAERGAPTLAAFKEIYCGETREEAIREVAPYLEEKYRHYADWGQSDGLTDAGSLTARFEELSRGRFIVGDAEDCLAQLRHWRDEIGVSHFMLRTEWAGMPFELARASVERLGERVLPALKGSA
jgi:alkanesulfonate monooxygenase SsuD/methylene tetrahydromethanopterin reductase-like flavin-dependent oxidoreductase (luciferase family)